VSWAATLDVFRWDGLDAVLNQHIFKVESHIDPDFHYWLLKASLEDLRRQTHGSGMVHITKRRFDSIPVPVPPRDQQPLIVRTLEGLFQRIDAALAEAQDAAALSRELAAASVADAVEGHEEVELSSVVTAVRYGTSVKCEPDAAGPAVLRIPNVRDGSLDKSELKFATVNGEDLGDAFVAPGDLLFIRTNGSRDLIGRVAAVDEAGYAFASYLIRARPDPARLDPGYAAVALSSTPLRREIERRAASSAGQYNLNIPSLKSLRIPLPSVPLQQRLAAEFAALRDAQRAAESEIEQALRLADVLKERVLRDLISGAVPDRHARRGVQGVRDVETGHEALTGSYA
jgi:type I restriction enzyme S subunit